MKVGGKQSLLVSFSAYSSTLKMEAICSSETSVDFQRTTRRYIPEDGTVLYCVHNSLPRDRYKANWIYSKPSSTIPPWHILPDAQAVRRWMFSVVEEWHWSRIFAEFLPVSPADHHSTIPSYSCTTASWSARQTRPNSTLFHPLSLRWGLLLWPDTRFVIQ
jgi:hypothetical protein